MTGFSADELKQLTHAGANDAEDLTRLRSEIDYQGSVMWDYLKNFANYARQVNWQPTPLQMRFGTEFPSNSNKSVRNGQDSIGLDSSPLAGSARTFGWMICFPSRAIDFPEQGTWANVGWGGSGIGHDSVAFRGPVVHKYAYTVRGADPLRAVARFERTFVLVDGSIPQAGYLTEAFVKQLLLKSMHGYLDGANLTTTDEYLKFSLGIVPRPNTSTSGGSLPELLVTGERAGDVIKEFFRQTLATRGQYGHVSYAYKNQYGSWEWNAGKAGWHLL